MTGLTSIPTSMLRRGLALAAGAALVGGVAACSPENIAERAIEAGSGGDVDIDIDDDGGQITVEGEDGTMTLGGGSIPDDFPTDAVPLIKGDIIFVQSSSDGDRRTYSIVLSVPDSPDDAWDRAKGDLVNAGFDVENETRTSVNEFLSVLAQFTSPEWTVQLNVTDIGDADMETSVTYSVESVT